MGWSGAYVHFEQYSPQLNSWFDVTAYPSSEGLSVYFKDITDRFRAQAEIRESKERYDLVNRATNDIIWDWNLVTNEIFWNSAFTDILGFSLKEEFNADWWLSNVHPEDKERVAEKIYQVIKTSGSWIEEYQFKCADGSYKYFLDRGYIYHNEVGVAVRMIGSMQDITELKKKEEEVAERNKRIMDIAHVNSHEVRKPLANILGLVEMLQAEDCSNQQEILLMLKESSEELDQCLKSIARKTSQIA